MRRSPWQISSGGGARPARWLGSILAVGLALACARCGGGGGGAGGGFDVVSFSATKQSPRVYLNDSIVIEFNQAVDPQTVFSGVYIYPSASAGAQRAQGELRVEGKKVIFTPNLPTDPNFQNGGFKPDTEYTICVPAPNDSCSLHIQNSPGLRTVSGRGLSQTRTETFRTVDVGGTKPAFRPEATPARPEIAKVVVVDANGVEQVLNPIVNLVTGKTWTAGILSTVASSPGTTLVPGSQPPRTVPRVHYAPTLLTAKVTSPIDVRLKSAGGNVLSKDPLVVELPSPSPPMAVNAFKDRGGVITIRDSSSPPVVASWAIDSNTTTQVTALRFSGPNFDAVGFKKGPYTAEVTQGITRQVAPGDVNTATAIKITFSEALNPLSVSLDSFKMYKVTDSAKGLVFAEVPPATTLKGSTRQGVTHEVVNGRSVITLKAKSSFPQSKPGQPATIVVTLKTAQPDNAVTPAPKSEGLRDLNNYPLAYPVRTGWVLALDPAKNVTTVAYVDPYRYVNKNNPPVNIDFAWAFQTRADTKVTNAIVETFLDRLNVSKQCRTTAAWTKAGQAGLYATYGYGGNGELGDATITGAVTIDSDTMTPGPGGIVELNYNRLVVATAGNMTLKGRYPIRINALEAMDIAGMIDASGQTGKTAPAGKALAVGRISGGRGGPGGGAGGDSNTKPSHPIGALPMEIRGGPGYPKAQHCGDLNKSDNRLITVIEPNCGGGTGGNRGVPTGTLMRSGCSGNGGGHVKDGQQTDYLCANIGAFGREYGVKWALPSGPSAVTTPTAGTGGGAGGNAAVTTGNPQPKDDIVAGSGGGGGGGLELACAGNLVVRASASILAVGGSGGAGYSTVVSGTTVSGGYGAGGSGGSIWVSGTSVTVESGATLDARGGKGNPKPPNPSRTGNGGDGYIIIRDRGNGPDIKSSNITPKEVAQRKNYSPPNNGKSVAYSAWYDSGEASPSWAFDANDPQTGAVVSGKDLVWLNQPAQGQKVTIMFQGAPDKGGVYDPDPTRWYPPGNTPQNPCAKWEPDISKLRSQGNLRHIRFRVTFDIGKRSKGVTPPNQVAIARIVINFQKPKM